MSTGILINVHANRKRSAIMELLKGQETATQLQALLNRRAHEDCGSASSVDDLAQQIWKSFADSLSQLSPCAESAYESSPEITAVTGGHDWSGRGSVCSRGRVDKAAAAKNRRGCYNRRMTSESWIRVSPITEDGYAWRKYGQKLILHFQHPRCYFRCSNKNEGCKATKQVQMIQENANIQYQTTYFHRHTCENDTIVFVPHELVLDQEPAASNLISFRANQDRPKRDLHHDSPHTVIVSDSAKEKEPDHDTEELCHAKSISLAVDPSKDIFGLEPLGYKPIFTPMSCSYEEVFVSGPGSSCTSKVGLSTPWFESNRIEDIDDHDLFDYLRNLD